MLGVDLPLMLQVAMIGVCLVFLVGTVYFVARRRLSLKYSLLWLFLFVVLLVLAFFPRVISILAGLLGFKTPANFVLSIGLFFLLAIAMMLSVTVSWQANYIRRLTQSVALLEKRLKDQDSVSDDDPSQERPPHQSA